MGRIVPFTPRDETLSRKTEEILTKIGDLYQQRLQAKEELPAVLARLLREGKADLAIEAMLAWGEGQKEPYEILTNLQAIERRTD